MVLEHYPVMRRTMESVAAERLNKIGKNPSIVTSRPDIEEDIHTMNELIMQTTPLASSGSEQSLYDPKRLGADRPGLRKSKSDCYVGTFLPKKHDTQEGESLV